LASISHSSDVSERHIASIFRVKREAVRSPETSEHSYTTPHRNKKTTNCQIYYLKSEKEWNSRRENIT